MPNPIHPGHPSVQAHDRNAALLAWFAAGGDPHQQPDGSAWLPGLPQSSAQPPAKPDRMFPPGEDRSPWALALRYGTMEAVQAALDAGAEPSRPIGIAWPASGQPQEAELFGLTDWRTRSLAVAAAAGSGWVPPGLAILSGPAEAVQPKLQLAQEHAENWLRGRWPDPHSQWATAVHMVVDLQAEAGDLRPQAVEAVARSLLDDLLAGVPHRVMARDRTGAVPLHWALARSRYAIAERLLAVLPIAQARAVDHAGNTVLHAMVTGAVRAAANPAAAQQAILLPPLQRIAGTLVAHGAMWDRQNSDGATAFDLAMQHFGTKPQAAHWRHLAGQ